MLRKSRTVDKDTLSVEQNEGAGARVRRSIGRKEIPLFDPFLLLDEFRVTPPGGFPDHPHRGFETVTYMLEGSFRHEDFCGHKSILNAGDVQWMSAGRGIVHCEMPNSPGINHGLQLWVNLRKADKMAEPAYQDISAKNIPVANGDGVTVRVIFGESLGAKSRIITRTPTIYLDFKLEKSGKISQPIPRGWNCFVYVIQGAALFGPEGNQVMGEIHHTLMFAQDGDCVDVISMNSEVCHFVLIAGEPIREHIVQQGVFVMTSEEEIKQAELDYRKSQNGFEGAAEWHSFVVYEDDDVSTLLPVKRLGS